MRYTMKRIILPLITIFLLVGASFVTASAEVNSDGNGGHDVTVGDIDSGQATVRGVIEAEQDYGIEEHREDAHVTASVTPAKLKDLFWRTVNFIALLILLIKFVFPFIARGLSGRRRQVVDELESLQAKRDVAERSYKDFESRLAGMEKEMEAVVQRAIAQAENEKVKIIQDAEKAAEDIKRQAEAAIQGEIVEARRTLRNEVADQAAALAEQLIVKNLTPEDQVKITEQYLDRIGAVQ